MGGYFDIDPASLPTCPKSDSCKNNDDHLAASSRPARAHTAMLSRSYYSLAVEAAAEMAAKAAASPLVEATAGVHKEYPEPNISFPADYIATVNSTIVINQGAAVDTTSGDLCCAPTAPQCQLQYGASGGTRYHDYSHNRTRMEDEDGHIIVDDYTTMKSMLINVTNGKETCQNYCPIVAPQEPGFPPMPPPRLGPFDPFVMDATRTL